MSYCTHPADAILEEPMQHMLSAKYRMSHDPPKEVLKQPLTPCHDRRVLLRLTLALHRVVC